jgi:hypothetical protein
MSSPSCSILRDTRPPARARCARLHKLGRGLHALWVSALALSLWSTNAKAATVVGGDLEYAGPISTGATSGWGFGIRLGQRFHVPLIAIDPELGFTYHSFTDASSPHSYRGIAGLRLGFGEIFRIGPFAHLGVGHLSLSGTPDQSHTAFTYDAGLFLDFTILPLLDIGIHGSYTQIVAVDAGPAFQFATVGANVALVF